MELTQVDQFYKTAIEELNIVNGRIMALNSFVNQSKERIDNDSRVGHELITSGLPFRNITLSKDQHNLFLANNYYALTRGNLKQEVELILSRECLFQIAQAYEILESYLYNEVTEFVRLKSGFHVFVDRKSNASTFDSIRKGLKGLNDRKNNKHLLSILRANSPSFATFEKENIYDLDFELWYELLSEARHCITHNRMRLTDDLNLLMLKSSNTPFQKQQLDGQSTLVISHAGCSELISKIADYIFFVYKCVAEGCYDTVIDFSNIGHILHDNYYHGYPKGTVVS